MRHDFTNNDAFDGRDAGRGFGPGSGGPGFGRRGPGRDGFDPRGGHTPRRGGGFPGGGFGGGFNENGFDEHPGHGGRGEHDENRHGDRRRGGRERGGRGFGGGFPGGRGGFEQFGQFGPGFGGPQGGPGRGGRGPGRGRRGDVRAAILALLGDEPMNGYQLINAIAEKSDGLWKPGAGSVYPALGLLEDEGLIAPTHEGNKKLYTLTDEGKTYKQEHADELTAPWERVAGPHKGMLDLRPELHQLGMALNQVAMSGDEAQIEAARGILDAARKDIYRLLAGDAPQTGDAAQG